MRPLLMFLSVLCIYLTMQTAVAVNILYSGKLKFSKEMDEIQKAFHERLKQRNPLEPTAESVASFFRDWSQRVKDNLSILERMEYKFPILKHRVLESLGDDSPTILKKIHERGIAATLSFDFNPLKFCAAEPDADAVLEDLYNELDGIPTFIQIFMRSHDLKLVGDEAFYKALQANDPYARAVMYASFKYGLFGIKGMEILAEYYKEGSHEETVKKMEHSFLTSYHLVR